MAQFGRPSADTYRDSWEEDDGTTDALYGEIDETVADDGDYIRTVIGPSNDVYVTKLSNLEDPSSSGGHIVRYRYAKSSSGGAQIDLTVQLRQGYVDEGTPGTQIAQWAHTNISDTWTTQQQTLSGAEADSITDYTSLYLRFLANQA